MMTTETTPDTRELFGDGQVFFVCVNYFNCHGIATLHKKLVKIDAQRISITVSYYLLPFPHVAIAEFRCHTLSSSIYIASIASKL